MSWIGIKIEKASNPAAVEEALKASLFDLSPLLHRVSSNLFLIPSNLIDPSKKQRALSLIRERLKPLKAKVGAAPSAFLAQLAAEREKEVLEEEKEDFLKEIPLKEVLSKKAAQFLEDVGITNLFLFSCLPKQAVAERIGKEALFLKEALEERMELPPPSFTYLPAKEMDFDPPICEETPLYFWAKRLGAELLKELSEKGLTCSLLEFVLELEDSSCLSFSSRSFFPFKEKDFAERLKWHLERANITSPIRRLSLRAMQVREEGSWQENLEEGPFLQRMEKAIEEVIKTTNTACFSPHLTTHRHPKNMVVLVPFKEEPPKEDHRKWVGALPRPFPAFLYEPPLRAEVRDEEGKPVFLNPDGLVSKRPQLLESGTVTFFIESFSPAWPWHDPFSLEEKAYMQVLSRNGEAFLLKYLIEDRSWWLEGFYN